MIFDAQPLDPRLRFAVVVSHYNEAVTSKLLTGAMDQFAKSGTPVENVDTIWAPGAFELPLLAQAAAKTRQYAAILCLGAVIRGETTHDQHINSAVSGALMRIGVKAGIPVLFGVLTCDTLEQAFARAGGAAGNKGVECAQAAMQAASVVNQLNAQRKDWP